MCLIHALHICFDITLKIENILYNISSEIGDLHSSCRTFVRHVATCRTLKHSLFPPPNL